MLLDRLIPSRCSRPSDALRRASELHALSTLVIGSEARKTQARVEDFKVTADAAERRSRAREGVRQGTHDVRILAAGVLLKLDLPRKGEG
jgi:hypothetical protein